MRKEVYIIFVLDLLLSQYHVTNYIISRTDQGYSIRLTVDGSISNEDCKGCYLQIEVN